MLFSLQTTTLFTDDAVMYPIITAKPLFVKTPMPASLFRGIDLNLNVFPPPKRWEMICRRERVSYPQGGRFGGVVVEKQIREILSVIQTPEDAFEKRKERCRTNEQAYLTEDFVDEVIYYRDEEVWERCIKTKMNCLSYATPAVDGLSYITRLHAWLRALGDPAARLEYLGELDRKKRSNWQSCGKKYPQPFTRSRSSKRPPKQKRLEKSSVTNDSNVELYTVGQSYCTAVRTNTTRRLGRNADRKLGIPHNRGYRYFGKINSPEIPDAVRMHRNRRPTEDEACRYFVFPSAK